jgi:Protein of unknown function (DUF2924)
MRQPTLNSLLGMSRAELLDTWVQVVGKPPVQSASRELLINTIAWHLQARQFGGLSSSVQRKLERLALGIARGEPVQPLAAVHRLRPGTTVERAWRGEIHVVTVGVDGFTYRSRHYRSLSEIARLITGTRWNGPAFFGLRRGNAKADAGSNDAS